MGRLRSRHDALANARQWDGFDYFMHMMHWFVPKVLKTFLGVFFVGLSLISILRSILT